MHQRSTRGDLPLLAHARLAGAHEPRLERAGIAAAVRIRRVPVIALFASLDDAVAA